MGKASNRKRNRKNLQKTECTYEALTENGRRCVELHGEAAVLHACMEAVQAGMAYPRLLLGEDGSCFAYDLEDPSTPTALLSLLKELRRKFGDYDRVPDWLAALAIEEPWEHAARGHTVCGADVLELHRAFPDIMVTPETTWALTARKHHEFLAEQEREALDAAARNPAVGRASPCRI